MNGRKKLRDDGFPTRADILHWTDAEHAIASAIQVVEKLGADVKLTEAVTLLSSAQDKVADFVESLPSENTTVRRTSVRDVLDASCPTCLAGPNMHCAPTTEPPSFHTARWRLAAGR